LGITPAMSAIEHNEHPDTAGAAAEPAHAAEAPAEQEVRTPGWLTAVGVGLFVLAGVGYLMTRPPGLTLEQLQPPAPSGSAAASAAPHPGPSAGPPSPGPSARPFRPDLPRPPGRAPH
jgi:hypothetical protein